jgi:hypothetical protein
MSFQKTTIKVALFLLFLFLLIVGILLYRAGNNVAFPPEAAECPDYWTVVGKNKCKAGDENLGNCFSIGKQIDISPFLINKESKYGLCKILKDTCGVEMDGITNVNLC